MYVPFCGSVTGLMKCPLVPVVNCAMDAPFGRSIHTVLLGMLTTDAVRLTRCPAVPVNVIAAFWPGVPMVFTVVEPSAPAAVASAGTVYTVVVTVPREKPCGSSTSLYSPSTGSVNGSMNSPEASNEPESSSFPFGFRIW